jgi:hypothetical protein
MMLVSSQRSITEHRIDMAELDRFGRQASEALLKRFESDHGYVEFPETIETCMSSSADINLCSSERAQNPRRQDWRGIKC